MPTRDAARSDAAASTLDRREPSEFAGEEPRLRRLAALPADHPERAALRDQLIMTFLPVGERIAGRYSAAWRAPGRTSARSLPWA